MVPVTGGRAKKYMKKKTLYRDDLGEIVGNLKKVEDFLPTPRELAMSDHITKVTLNLSTRSVDFFKNEADKHSNASYQNMIRKLLDTYVDHVS